MVAAWVKLFGPALRWLTPGRRRLLLSIAALYVGAKYSCRTIASIGNPWRHAQPDLLLSVALFITLFGFVLLCWLAAKRFASLPKYVQRHPQICLHAVFWALLVVVWITKPRSGFGAILLTGCVFALPFLLWRVGYMMFTAQRGKITGTKFTDHLFYIFPYWGGSDTPYGKGFDYLSANEARDETSLAKSQLAGLKCFILAGLWALLKLLLAKSLIGGGGVPRLGAAFANPQLYPPWLCWIAIYLQLLLSVLSVAVTGHLIVGWLRLFGFYVFRNTYKPLLAESVVEFWNRYYYYFKELLVNFFFYPTFTRFFKNSPRLRILVAVFAAAFVGNMYYHWLRLDHQLATGNFRRMWAVLESRVVYCFLLAAGIFISMLREQQRAKTKRVRTGALRALAIFGVWTFFSVIHIWAQKDPASLMARVNFFFRLFGLV